jgi:uncharacterized membrane protein
VTLWMMWPLLLLLVAVVTLLVPIAALAMAIQNSRRVRALEARLQGLESARGPAAAAEPAPASAPAAGTPEWSPAESAPPPGVARPAPEGAEPGAPAAPPATADALTPAMAAEALPSPGAPAAPGAAPPGGAPAAPWSQPGAETAPRPGPAAPGGTGWRQIEERLGERWLNRVGVVVLVVGVGFFLKYAFDNAWIGPSGRVALGLLTGIALLGLGERLQRAAYRVPAQGLSAAGLATLYLSGYAADGFYQLVPQALAFLFLVLVTATGLALALHRDARAIAILANLGGFLTPVILSAGRDAAVPLFTYLAILDAGMLVAASRRRWWELGALSFAFTQLLYAGWYGTWYAPPKLGIALAAASVFFVLFALVTPAQVLGRGSPSAAALWPTSTLLVFAAPLAYFLAARAVLYPDHRPWLGLLCLVLATWHLLAGQWAARQPGAPPVLRVFYVAIGLAFLTLTFPVQLTDHALAIAWSAEGAALLWGAFRLEEPRLRLGAVGVLALAGARWLDLVLTRRSYEGVFVVDHPAFASTLAFALAGTLAFALYRRRGERRERWEWAAEPLLLLAATAALAVFLGQALETYRPLPLPAAFVSVFRLAIWAVAALPLLAFADHDRTRVLLWAVTLLLVGLGVAGLDVEGWRRLSPELRPAVANPRFLVGLLIVTVYALYARLASGFPVSEAGRTRLRGAGAAGAVLFLLWTLSAEVMLLPLPGWSLREAANLRNAALSILWTLYAFAAIGVGIGRDVALLRGGGIALFALTVAKVFLVDLSELEAIYRILSFVVLGAVLLLASFVYTRYRAGRAASEPSP